MAECRYAGCRYDECRGAQLYLTFNFYYRFGLSLGLKNFYPSLTFCVSDAETNSDAKGFFRNFRFVIGSRLRPVHPTGNGLAETLLVFVADVISKTDGRTEKKFDETQQLIADLGDDGIRLAARQLA